MLQRIGNFYTMLHYTSKDKKDETIFLPFYTLQQVCEFLSPVVKGANIVHKKVNSVSGNFIFKTMQTVSCACWR